MEPDWFAHLNAADQKAAHKLRAQCGDGQLQRIALAVLKSKRGAGRPKGPGALPARKRLATLTLQNPNASPDVLRGIVIDEIAAAAPWARDAGYHPQTMGNARRHLAGRSLTIGELKRASDSSAKSQDGIPLIDRWLTARQLPGAAVNTAPVHAPMIALAADAGRVAARYDPERDGRRDAVICLMREIARLADCDLAEAVQVLGDVAMRWEASRQRVQELPD